MGLPTKLIMCPARDLDTHILFLSCEYLREYVNCQTVCVLGKQWEKKNITLAANYVKEPLLFLLFPFFRFYITEKLEPEEREGGLKEKKLIPLQVLWCDRQVRQGGKGGNEFIVFN